MMNDQVGFQVVPPIVARREAHSQSEGPIRTAPTTRTVVLPGLRCLDAPVSDVSRHHSAGFWMLVGFGGYVRKIVSAIDEATKPAPGREAAS